MGLYVFGNSALAGFFLFAAIHYALTWRQPGRERLMLAVIAHSLICAALSACFAIVATAATAEAQQSALNVRTTVGLLSLASGAWLLSLLSGVAARRFILLVTAVSSCAAIINELIFPLNGVVTEVARIRLAWGEEVFCPLHSRSGWWIAPLYAMAASVQVFGLLAARHLWRRDRLAAVLVIVASLGSLAAVAVGAAKDLFQSPVPSIGLGPVSALLILVALSISGDYYRQRRKLEEQEAELQAVFEHTVEFIGLISTDGILLRTNRTALKFAGIAAEDVIGKKFWETPWWQHSRELQKRLREGIESAAIGSVARFEATHAQPDGRVAHIDVTIKPVRNERGVITMLISEGRDVTARKEAEEKLRESDQFNKEIIESAPNGLIVMNRDFTYRLWNSRMEEFSGLPASAVLGSIPWNSSHSWSRTAFSPPFSGRWPERPSLPTTSGTKCPKRATPAGRCSS
jgi:PAS domain S-box-containing protein